VQTWTQLHLTLDAGQADAAEAALAELGAQSISLAGADAAEHWCAAAESPAWQRVRLSALFPADADRDAIRAALVQLGHALPPDAFETLVERDWVAEWTRSLAPMRFGTRLWICPTPTSPPPGSHVVVRIDPGHAFGSGTHETTAMCLRWLDAHDLDAIHVLDVGCGSGILGIAALCLGAAAASACDVDPLALDACAANARANGVADRLRVEGATCAGGTFDLVIANILASTLMALAPDLAARTRAGGTLLLAGVLEDQAAEVIDCFTRWFEIDVRSTDNHWVLLEGRRRPRGDT
jgi:ribosomal protein L11 methyltransferase